MSERDDFGTCDVCDPPHICTCLERSACDGCGARVAMDQLSLTTFPEGEGFVCDECKRETVVNVGDELHQILADALRQSAAVSGGQGTGS